MADSQVTLTGNLAADPELKYTNSGAAVVKFRIGVNRRIQKNGEYSDKTTWWNVEAWNTLAENIAATLSKGMRVVVSGELDADEYTNQAGEKRTAVYVRADKVGPDLRWATASVERNARAEGNGAAKAPARSGGKLDGYGDGAQYDVGASADEPF